MFSVLYLFKMDPEVRPTSSGDLWYVCPIILDRAPLRPASVYGPIVIEPYPSIRAASTRTFSIYVDNPPTRPTILNSLHGRIYAQTGETISRRSRFAALRSFANDSPRCQMGPLKFLTGQRKLIVSKSVESHLRR